MSLGMIDVAIAALFLLGGTVLQWQKNPFSRWGFGLAFCILLAGVVTPADPLSTLIVGAGMTLCMGLGAWLQALPHAERVS